MGLFDVIRRAAEGAESAARSTLDDLRRNVTPQIFNAVNTASNILTLIPREIGNSVGRITSSVQQQIAPLQNQINQQIGQLNNTIYNQVANISGVIGNQTGQIFSGLRSVQDSVSANLTNVITSTVGNIGRNIGSIENNVINGIKGTINTSNALIDATRNAITLKVQDLKGDIASQGIKLVTEIHNQTKDIVNIGKSVENTVRSVVNTKVDEVKNLVSNSIGNIGSSIGNLSGTIGSQINNIENRISSTINSQVGSLGVAISQLDDQIIGNLQNTLRPISNLANTLPDLGVMIADTIIDNALGFIEQKLGSTAKDLLKFGDVNPGIIKDLLDGKFENFDQLKRRLDAEGIAAGAAGLIILVLMYASAIAGSVTGLGQPIAEQFANFTRKVVKPNLLEVNDIAEAFFRARLDKNEAKGLIEALGYTSDKAEKILENRKSLLTPNEYGFMRQLGLIDGNNLDYYLGSNGFDEWHREKLKELFKFRPSVQDLISMAVKEVFTPEVAQKFGQYEDFPPDFKTQAQAIGIPEEWAKRYWAAHWGLPSPQMGFEMFQRDIIDYDTLKLLLKSLDIMPYWREKLIELNYNPLTRVDIRRMYGLGVIDEREVEKAYRATGYSPENAKLLTEFTIKYEQGDGTTVKEKDKELTRAIIERAYKFGVFTREQAEHELKGIGYQDDDIQLLLDLVDKVKQIDSAAERIEKHKDRTIKTILNGYQNRTFGYLDSIKELVELGYTVKDAELELKAVDNEYEIKIKQYISDAAKDGYVSNVIDKSETITMLIQGGFTANEAERYINELDILKTYRIKKPTLAQLQKMLKRDIITIDEFIYEVKGLGYAPKYINWFIQESIGLED